MNLKYGKGPKHVKEEKTKNKIKQNKTKKQKQKQKTKTKTKQNKQNEIDPRPPVHGTGVRRFSDPLVGGDG